MTKRSTILWIAICGIAFLISLVVFRRYLPYTGRAIRPQTAPAVMLTLEDSYLVGSHKGTKLWSMRAKLIELSYDRTTTHISDIKNGVLYVQDKPILTLSAAKAYYNIDNRDLRLTGGLDIKIRNGPRVRSAGAKWNSAESILRSIGGVQFVTRQSSVWARRLIVDVKRRQATMWNVTFTLDPRDLGRDKVSKDAG